MQGGEVELIKVILQLVACYNLTEWTEANIDLNDPIPGAGSFYFL